MKNSDKFVVSVSHDPEVGTVDTGDAGGSESGKFDSTTLITTIGSNLNSFLEIFKKPDTNNVYNITQGDDSKKEDHTMLYLGIGGGVLLLSIVLILALKK